MKKNYIAVIMGVALIATMLGGCSQDEATVVEINKQVQPAKTEEATAEGTTGEKSDLQFVLSTTDIDGNTVGLEDFADAKLIMVNFWEPWCGPCVGEMPDLEKLYEEYSSDGFVILGIYSTDDMDDEVRKVLDSCGTTYPILKYDENMEPFITDFVPTTIFIDGNGNVLTDEPEISAKSYDDWKNIIEAYMNR